MSFGNDWDALEALFKCSQYRENAQARYDEAKRDLRDAKEIQAEIVRRINAHVVGRKGEEARRLLIDKGTSAEGLRDLRSDLGMGEFGKKSPEGE